MTSGSLFAKPPHIPLTNWKVDRAAAIATNSISANAVFVGMTPCRVIDTREPSFGAYGAPVFAAGEVRTYNMTTSACPGIPVAVAYSVNVTIVNYDVNSGGWVTLYPADVPRPFISTVNFGNGTNAVANAAIVPADGTGSIDAYAAGLTNIIININGYFLAQPSSGVTSVTAGNSINVSPTTGDVVVKVADGGITNTQLAPLSVATGNIQTGAVGNAQLASSSVATGNIQTGAVTTNEILDGTILSGDLHDGAVTTTKILDANVTLPKISPTGATAGQTISFDGTNIVWLSSLNTSNSAVQTTDVSNICAINLGSGVGVNNASGLSLGGLNGAAASTAIVFVTANGGTTAPFTATFPRVAVAFVSAATVNNGDSTCSPNKWVIYTIDGSAMPSGLKFNVFGAR
jgi:hypothetical protein